jgi:uncharacterized protein (DUF305 family)
VPFKRDKGFSIKTGSINLRVWSTNRAPRPGAGATAAMMSSMDRMHGAMNQVQVSGDPDRDFVALMIPHHQSAVDMARIYLETGRDPELRRLAEQILASQQAEIQQMQGRMNGQAGAPHPGH